VPVKLVITVVATAVLLLQPGPIGDAANVAAQATGSLTDLGQTRLSLVVHSGGGLVVLLVPMVLSVFKPWGMTRYGQRRRRLAADVLGSRPQSVTSPEMLVTWCTTAPGVTPRYRCAQW